MTRVHPLSDFRMADVQFEVVTLLARDRIEERARIAGHFYYVIDGCIEGCSVGREPKVANRGAALVVTGYLGHYIQARRDSVILVGTEPHKHLIWLSRTMDIVCVGEDDKGPLLDRLRGVMELIVGELSDPEVPPDQLTLERYAELTLFYFLRIANPQASAFETPPWNDEKLMAAVEAMSQNPAADWTVAKLAEAVHMSRSAFALRFKTSVGETPMQTLTRIRLRAAAQKILLGESVLETALSVGYGSEEAFSRAFSRLFGLSPGRWKRAHLS